MQDFTTEKTMTTKEVAEMLGIKARSVNKLAMRIGKKTGKGKHSLWTEEEITALLLERTKTGKLTYVNEESKDYLASLLAKELNAEQPIKHCVALRASTANTKDKKKEQQKEQQEKKEEERKKTEKEIVGMWIDVCKRAAAAEHCYFNCWRIESGDTQIGIPDLFVQVADMCVWLECKSRTKSSHQFHFQPMQLRNLHNLFVHGTASGILLFDEPLMQANIISAVVFSSSFINTRARNNFGKDLPDWFGQLKHYVSTYYRNKDKLIAEAKERENEY